MKRRGGETLSELKERMRKVKRDYENLVRKQDWALSQYLVSGDDRRLKAVDLEMKQHLAKQNVDSEVSLTVNGPTGRAHRRVRESALLEIQEKTLSTLATGKLQRDGLPAFVDAEISNLSITEALAIYEDLATLDDEEKNAALIERMLRAAQRGKKTKNPIEIAGAAIRLARFLLISQIASWACAIVDGTVPKPLEKTSRRKPRPDNSAIPKG